MKKILLILFIVFNSLTTVNAQDFPPYENVFTDTELSKIYITLASDSINAILANPYSDHEYPATFQFVSSTLDTTVENIGLRLRGNTSRSSQKKSFKISFNTFVEGRKLFGLEKMNINGEHNDPTISRAKISWDIFRFMEVPAPRANHVKLFINNTFKGVYINVEHIDEEFVESRFGNKDGNLYKCLWPATLEYKGSDPNLYKTETNGLRTYDLKTNTEQDNYSDLANFIYILNNTPVNDFPKNLEPIFNVNSFLKYLAVEVLTAHWDGYSYNKNNFYLYNNTRSGKFEFIPYDPDNTFGIDWFNEDWAIRNIYNWASSENRPLTKKILQNQMYKDRFSFYLNKLLTEYFNETVLNSHIDEIKNLISAAAQNDTYRTLDYGWNFTDFNNSFDTNFNNQHVKYGLKGFITTRNNSAQTQLILNTISPIVSRVYNSSLVANRDFKIHACAEDENSELNVQLFYRKNGGEFINMQMLDNGLDADKLANDKFYSSVISQPLSSAGNIEYYVTATDLDGKTTREPFQGYFTETIAEPSNLELYINEFMASNQTTVSDNYNEFDDWIEIYNAGNSTIWLGNKYLSDNAGNPGKWQMPNINIEPKQFLLFWADDQREQGEMHTNFKLSASGEELGIYDSFENDYAEIDFVKFGLQTVDLPLARITDGFGEFNYTIKATPGGSNTANGISELEFENRIKIYPNPISENLSIQAENINSMKIQIYNILGQQIYSETAENSIQINFREIAQNKGIYIVKINFVLNEKMINFSKQMIFN